MSKNKTRHTPDSTGRIVDDLTVKFRYMDSAVIDFLSGLSHVDIEMQEVVARKLIAAGFVEEAREILRMTRVEYEDFVCNALDEDGCEN